MSRIRSIAAVMCVLVMIACPLACAVSDTEGSADKETAATVKLENLGNEQIDKLFDLTDEHRVERTIYDIFKDPMGLNYNLVKNGTLTGKIMNFDYSAGKKCFVADDEKSASIRYYGKITCSFDIKLRMFSSEPTYLLDQEPEVENFYYYGDGVSQMERTFGKTMLSYNEVFEIKGTLEYEYTSDVALDDMVKTVNDGYYGKVDRKSINICTKWDVTAIVKDKWFRDVCECTRTENDTKKYIIVNGDEKECTDGIPQMANLETCREVRCNAERMFEGKAYNYSAGYLNAGTVKCGPVTDKLMVLPDLSKYEKVSYSDLYLMPILDDETISKTVSEIGGTAGRDVGVFDSTYDSLNKEMNPESESNTLYFIVGLVVILAIIALVMVYIDKRMDKPKN